MMTQKEEQQQQQQQHLTDPLDQAPMMIFGKEFVEEAVPLINNFRSELNSLKEQLLFRSNSSDFDSGHHRAMSLSLLRIREYNRHLSLYIRDCKKRVQSDKNTVDKAELSHQSALYERRHLLASIEDARRHESLYIKILQLANTNDSIASFSHMDILNMLNQELTERKAMTEQLKSKTGELELAKSRIVLKRKELERIRDQLDTILKSTESFNISHARLFASLQKKEQEEALRAAVAASMPLRRSSSSHNNLVAVLPQHNSDAILKVYQLLQDYSSNNEAISVELISPITTSLSINTTSELDQFHGELGEVIEDQEEEEGAITINEESSDSESKAHRSRFEKLNITLPIKLSDDSSSITTTNTAQMIKLWIGTVHLLIHHAIPDDFTSPLVIGLIPPEEHSTIADVFGVKHMSNKQKESFLLTLPFNEPSMRLTLAHDSIIPEQSGTMPFRWLQCLGGIYSDHSFEDSTQILRDFVQACFQCQNGVTNAYGDDIEVDEISSSTLLQQPLTTSNNNNAISEGDMIID